jgi:hypothetical protein
MQRFNATVFFIFLLSPFAHAQSEKVSWGFFLDSNYAFDSNRPPNRERSFTTVPAKHNEFGINLAHIEGVFTSERVRGRLALQAGTSVVANYSTEYRDPSKTGGHSADLLQHIQEATMGYRLTEALWLDAGIYFSHIGLESFISKQNWTYTRSLIADFSPYYQTGARLTYELSPQWSFQLHILNGWQNIIENNSDKALGTQIAYKPSDRIAVVYNTFLGHENGTRFLNDFTFSYRIGSGWDASLALDFGLQSTNAGTELWWGTSLINRFRVGETTHLALRLEAYQDPESVIVTTGTSGGFQVVGASANIDEQLTAQLLWRNEVRVLRATDSIFPAASGGSSTTVFGVTSLSLAL